MECIKKSIFFTENDIRKIMLKLLSGLRIIHQKGFFHRDIKPENIILKKKDSNDF